MFTQPRSADTHALRSYSSWSSVSTKVAGTSPDKQASSLSRHRSLAFIKPDRGNEKRSPSLPLESKKIVEEQEGVGIDVLFVFATATLYKLPVAPGGRRDYDAPPPLPVYLTSPSLNEASNKMQSAWQVACGKFQIYRIAGQPTPYLKVGTSFVHPILPKLRVWRVQRDQFVMPQPNPGAYWRLEMRGLHGEEEQEMERILGDSCSYQCSYVWRTGENSESDEDQSSVVAENFSEHGALSAGPIETFDLELDLDLDFDPLGFPLSSTDITLTGRSHDETQSHFLALDGELDGTQHDYPSPILTHGQYNLYPQTNSSSSSLDLYLDDFDDNNLTSHFTNQPVVNDNELQLHTDLSQSSHIHIHHHYHYPTSPAASGSSTNNETMTTTITRQIDNSKGYVPYWQKISRALTWNTASQ